MFAFAPLTRAAPFLGRRLRFAGEQSPLTAKAALIAAPITVVAVLALALVLIGAIR